MDQQLKSDWIVALRSGDYIQGGGALKRDLAEDPEKQTYCCLGVLCDVLVNRGKGEWVRESDTSSYHVYRTENFTPESVDAFGYGPEADPVAIPEGLDLGIGTTGEIPEGVYIEDGYDRKFNTLMALNDSTQFTFEQIADVIEEHF